MTRLFVLVFLSALTACGQTDRKDSLENTIALFVTNGMKRTPALDDEITRAFYGVTTYSQLQAELTSLRKALNDYKAGCHSSLAANQLATSELDKQLEQIRNRTAALQVIAFQHKWPIDERYRFKTGELSCYEQAIKSD